MKENMPTSFLTDFISRGWTEIGDLKNTLQNIGQDFKNGNEIKAILQDLSDAYMICVGRLEKYLDDADYIEQTPIDAATATDSDSIAKPEMPVQTAQADATVSVEDKPFEAAEPAKTAIIASNLDTEAKPTKVITAIEDDVDTDVFENSTSTEQNTDRDVFEYEVDFDDVPVTNDYTDEDIEDLRRMFHI